MAAARRQDALYFSVDDLVMCVPRDQSKRARLGILDGAESQPNFREMLMCVGGEFGCVEPFGAENYFLPDASGLLGIEIQAPLRHRLIIVFAPDCTHDAPWRVFQVQEMPNLVGHGMGKNHGPARIILPRHQIAFL